jgi:hypothetical protein
MCGQNYRKFVELLPGPAKMKRKRRQEERYGRSWDDEEKRRDEECDMDSREEDGMKKKKVRNIRRGEGMEMRKFTFCHKILDLPLTTADSHGYVKLQG